MEVMTLKLVSVYSRDVLDHIMFLLVYCVHILYNVLEAISVNVPAVLTKLLYTVRAHLWVHMCVQQFFLGQCIPPASSSPVCKCIVSLTTLSQMLQSPWGWCCWMRLPPPRETSAREEVRSCSQQHVTVPFLFSLKFEFLNVIESEGSDNQVC